MSRRMGDTTRPCKPCAIEDGVNLEHCTICEGEGCLTCQQTGRVEVDGFDWSDYATCPFHAREAYDAEHEDDGRPE
jgi:hypothetical protein